MISLDNFRDYPKLQQRITDVLNSLPLEVQSDFQNDPCFRISLDDYRHGRGRVVVLPDLNQTGSSRCVVLKPRLEKCSDAFAKYIIAHEFAHAFLHNGGWNQIKDVELAADALASHWGYAKQPYEHV